LHVNTALLAHEGHASAKKFFTSGTAPSYDSVSLLATFGMDRAWKRRTVEIVAGRKNVLDLASGTGILSSMISAKGASVTGLDLTFEYLVRSPANTACQGTAEVLPFRDAMFDAVVSSYLAKYADSRLAVDEAWRVLQPGGVAVFHDFACPKGAMRSLWNAYFALLRLAGVFSKSWRPVFGELDGVICRSCWVDKFSEAMRAQGFCDVDVSYHTRGTAAMVWGHKR
jgi:demethylmenaquinone methyltransferase/2-methoxy-6-polyprenyl-1,4-benzoquinol methylase